MKLDIKDQLFMSLEGNTICRPGQNYTTDITFVCNKTAVSIKKTNNIFRFINYTIHVVTYICMCRSVTNLILLIHINPA